MSSNSNSSDGEVTVTVNSIHMSAMTAALRECLADAQASGFTLEAGRTTRVLTTPGGRVIFRAMKGRNGTWLVTHAAELFLQG